MKFSARRAARDSASLKSMMPWDTRHEPGSEIEPTFYATHVERTDGTRGKREPKIRGPCAALPTFHGVPTEGPVLSADRQRLLVVFALVPSLERVEAIPLLDGDAFWWRSLK